MDERQRAISYGQAINLASDYWHNQPGVQFGNDDEFINTVLLTADKFHHEILKRQESLVEEAAKRAKARMAEAAAAADLPAVVSGDMPRTQMFRPVEDVPAPVLQEPPPDVHHDSYEEAPASDPAPGGFLFDYESSVVWQTNNTVRCPKCGFPSQKWDKNWLQRQPNRNGNRPPAYRCGSFSYDQSRKGPPLFGWVSSQVPPCDWVEWRDKREYPN